MPNVRDHDTSVYLRLQGDALSVGGYEQNPIFWEEVILNNICSGAVNPETLFYILYFYLCLSKVENPT